MAENATNNLVYYAKINCSMIEYLGEIRNWNNLSIAFEDEYIWIKGFHDNQLNSVEIKSIPNIKIFYSNKGKLFPKGFLLPVGNEPSFLWTPINRGLKVEIPNHNPNFFGIKQKINIRITQSIQEKESAAMITSFSNLETYAVTAPIIRLQKIQWTLLDQNTALLIGTPILPIKGDTYWKTEDFLLPSGFDFELNFLTSELNKKLNLNQTNFIIWDKDAKYFMVDKLELRPLSISSIRKTKNSLLMQK